MQNSVFFIHWKIDKCAHIIIVCASNDSVLQKLNYRRWIDDDVGMGGCFYTLIWTIFNEEQHTVIFSSRIYC